MGHLPGAGRWRAPMRPVADLSGALAAGADEVLHKSTPMTQIVATLSRLLSGRDRNEA